MKARVIHGLFSVRLLLHRKMQYKENPSLMVNAMHQLLVAHMKFVYR